jgi:hypothetical protein
MWIFCSMEPEQGKTSSSLDVYGLCWLWGVWALVCSLGAPSAEAAERFLPEDTRGSWHKKEEMPDGVVTGCQTACGLL